MKLEQSPFDLRQSMYEVCMALGNRALEKGLELICDLDQQLPMIVVGDDLRCRQVFYNLIGNAIKFTDRGEVIVRGRVAAADQDIAQSHVVLEVEDTGIGISQQQLDQLFDSFWQADSYLAGGLGGTGLGTTIARDITQLMGGAISVESELGRGSLFRVKLPLISDNYTGRETLPDVSVRDYKAIICESNASYRELLVKICTAMGISCEAVATSGQLHAVAENLDDRSVLAFLLVSDSPGGRDLKSLVEIIRTEFGLRVPVIYLIYPGRRLGLNESSGFRLYKPFLTGHFTTLVERCLDVVAKQAGKSWPVPEPLGHRSGLDKVLVAEDNSVSALVLDAFLKRLGYQVTLVKNGRQALDALDSGPFSAVIVDLNMPEMDGMAFTHNYRAREREEQHLPIIAVTASAEEDVRIDCLAAGMDDFLTKPVAQDQLALVMRRHIRLPDQVSITPA